MANGVLREKALTIACEEDGTLTANKSIHWGKRIGDYLASIGLPQGHDYCAAFVYWTFQQAAREMRCVNPLPRTGSVPALYKFAESRKLLADKPCRGDIYITRAKGHTGMIEVTPPAGQLKNCRTIEGNTYIGDHLWGVHRRTRDLSDAFFVRV